jgi:hypothetical protein
MLSKADSTQRFLTLPVAVQYLLALLFVTVALYISLMHHPIGGYGSETDFYWDYAPAADAFFELRLPWEHLSFRGPGYPIFLALLKILFRDTFTAAKIISALSAGVVVFLSQRFFTREFGVLIGLIGMAALILNGVFLNYSIRAGTDMFFMAIFFSFIYLLTLKPHPVRLGIAGFLAGWGFLTRYNGIALVATLLVYLIWMSVVRKRVSFKRVAPALVACFAVVGLWGAVVATHEGKIDATVNRQNILYEVEAAGKVGWEQFWYTSHESIGSPPVANKKLPLGKIAATAFGNLYHNFLDDHERLIGSLMGATALAGVVLLAFGRASAGGFHWGLAAAVFHYIILLFVFHSVRFSLTLVPVYIFLSIIFFRWLGATMFSDERKFWFVSILCFLSLVMIEPPQTWGRTISKLQQDPRSLISFASQANSLHITGGAMAARKPHLPYLLGCRFKALPFKHTPEDLIGWMQAEAVDYLFISPFGISQRPELARLANPDADIRGLTLLLASQDETKGILWKRDK